MSEFMTVPEFIEKYCKHLIVKKPESEFNYKSLSILDDEKFTYDTIIENEEGEKEKVVYDSDLNSILVSDIVLMYEDEFKDKYKTEAASSCYTNYLSSFTILFGEDVLNYMRAEMEREMKKINSSFESLAAFP